MRHDRHYELFTGEQEALREALILTESFHKVFHRDSSQLFWDVGRVKQLLLLNPPWVGLLDPPLVGLQDPPRVG